MTVYALFHETDGDEGQIEALYLNEADAERARLAHIRAARDAGLAIYWDPDTGEENDHWDHNWRVDVETVHAAAPDVACPKCGDVSQRANPDDKPETVACGSCGCVGMVLAQCEPAEHEDPPAASASEPHPLVGILMDLHYAANKTAENSCADAVQDIEMSVRDLANVIGVSLPDPDSY